MTDFYSAAVFIVTDLFPAAAAVPPAQVVYTSIFKKEEMIQFVKFKTENNPNEIVEHLDAASKNRVSDSSEAAAWEGGGLQIQMIIICGSIATRDSFHVTSYIITVRGEENIPQTET